jgi:hypothetical protein
MLLTLPIGLVSVNLPLSVNAQNSVLSQGGNDNHGGQNMDHFQSSNQDGQVVSGDSSILSGNNLICQNQESSKALQALTGICNFDESGPPSNGVTATLNLTIFVESGFCELFKCSFLVRYGGEVIQRDITSSTSVEFNIPVGLNFLVIVHGNQEERVRGAVIANSDCIVGSVPNEFFVCQGIKNSQPTSIFVAIDRRP